MEMCREDGGRLSSHSQALNLDRWWKDGDLRCRELVSEEGRRACRASCGGVSHRSRREP